MALSVFVSMAAWAQAAKASLRGKLRPGDTPALLVEGKEIALGGDKATMGVLGDARLKDADFEVRGEPAGDGKFQVDPIHTRSMFVHKQGKRLMISYWCEVCSIRTYSPGVCMCCQDETALDLKERFDE
jgi:hypothetical protein